MQRPYGSGSHHLIARLPRIVFGSAYADMRLVPYMLAIFVLAIRFKAETTFPLARTLAVAGMAFLLVRTAGTTASLAIAANHQRAQLSVLDAVPEGSRVVSLVWSPCKGWANRRSDHLPSMVIVRRDGFSNDQWGIEGVNLLDLAALAVPANLRPDGLPGRLRVVAVAGDSLVLEAGPEPQVIGIPQDDLGIESADIGGAKRLDGRACADRHERRSFYRAVRRVEYGVSVTRADVRVLEYVQLAVDCPRPIRHRDHARGLAIPRRRERRPRRCRR